MSIRSRISCPYCDHILNKMPSDHSQCPGCGQILFVYESVLGNRKILLTEEGARKLIKVPPSQEQNDYFTSRLIELEAAFRKAKGSTKHYGELGRELEALVKDFLIEYLPNKYSVATGFVRSLEKPGWQSNQIDILLSRSDICYPIAVHREYKVFPLESIISFVEVTSNLTPAKLLEDYEKVADLQRLHKRVYYVPEPPASLRFHPTGDSAVRPRFYYFAFSTDCNVETIEDALLELSNDYSVQLHCLFVLKPTLCLMMPNAQPDALPQYQALMKETRPREAIISFLQHILISLQTADFIPYNASIPFEEYFHPTFKIG